MSSTSTGCVGTAVTPDDLSWAGWPTAGRPARRSNPRRSRHEPGWCRPWTLQPNIDERDLADHRRRMLQPTGCVRRDTEDEIAGVHVHDLAEVPTQQRFPTGQE